MTSKNLRTLSQSVDLFTVRHSGSHFAQRILGCDRWIHADRPDLLTKPAIVLTMRHPMMVAQSWLKRGRELDQRFRMEWDNLFHVKGWPNTHWLPIDTDDRTERLQALSEALGVPLHTNWQPLNVNAKNCRLHKRGMTLEQAREWFKTLPFGQFGYRI